MKNLVKNLAIALCLILSTSIAFADEESESTNGIIVHDAVAAPAKKGERTKLRLKITNHSLRNLYLKSVRAGASSSTTIEMRLDGKTYVPVQGIAILREETLDLTSSHISLALVDLTRALKVGSKVEFILEFGEFETNAVADVH